MPWYSLSHLREADTYRRQAVVAGARRARMLKRLMPDGEGRETEWRRGIGALEAEIMKCARAATSFAFVSARGETRAPSSVSFHWEGIV